MPINESVVSVKKNSAKDKLNNLWRDKRKYTTRILVAASASFALCFTFLFFGPIEIVAFSADSLSFTLMEILPLMAIFMLIATTILSFLLSLLKGRVYNYLVTAVFSLVLCGYAQGNFLNGSLGALTGDAIAWQERKVPMAVNLFIWLILFIILFFLLYFNEKIWRKVVMLASITLVIMQLVALIAIMIGPAANSDAKKTYYLTKEKMVTYSKEKNTLVFILDRLDYEYIEEVLAKNSSFFDELDGFTSYANAISEYARTSPAANFMLTGAEKTAYHIPTIEYYDTSWDYKGVNILKDLYSANYKTNIYTYVTNMFGTGDNQKDYVENLSSESSEIIIKRILVNLVSLSAYRYSPVALKPFFWCYTDDINNGVRVGDNEYRNDEGRYAKELDKIELVDDTNYFKLYHFNGSHPPYTIKADGMKSDNPTTAEEQTRGSFQILFNAFKEMKKQGIYKNASIIITADHGSPVDNAKPLQKANRIGIFYKPAGKEGTALLHSQAPVSLKNIPSTIIKSAGLDYSTYGKPLDEVAENEEITRMFYKSVIDDTHERKLYVYEVNGNAADFNNWKEVRIESIEYPFY